MKIHPKSRKKACEACVAGKMLCVTFNVANDGHINLVILPLPEAHRTLAKWKFMNYWVHTT
jgi:hypothetical protein